MGIRKAVNVGLVLCSMACGSRASFHALPSPTPVATPLNMNGYWNVDATITFDGVPVYSNYQMAITVTQYGPAGVFGGIPAVQSNGRLSFGGTAISDLGTEVGNNDNLFEYDTYSGSTDTQTGLLVISSTYFDETTQQPAGTSRTEYVLTDFQKWSDLPAQ